MFRLLALHPGPDITAPAAASLAGTDPPQARRQLRELTRGYLLTEHTPGRYALHDLLRAYATEQTHSTDHPRTRHDATTRILDHYLHTAHTAALLLEPTRKPITLAPAQPGVTAEQIADSEQALAWFEAEHRVLISAVSLAAETGYDTCAWELPWALTSFLDWQGHWHEWAAVEQTAMTAAARLGNTARQAAACRLLASACARLGDNDRARTFLAECLELYQQLEDKAGQARAHHSLCWMAVHTGRHADALGHAEQALTLYQAAGEQAGRAGALNAVGFCRALLGDYRQALAFCRQALALNRELGDRHGEAHCSDSLGYAEHKLGRLANAARRYRHALSIFTELGDRPNEADTLTRLGDTCQAAGDQQGAQDAWRQALVILDDLHHPDAHQVRAKLTTAGGRPHPEPAAAGSAPGQQ